jgi:carbamoyltransferase
MGENISVFQTSFNRLGDIASTLQQIFINKILKKLAKLQEKTGTEHLYYTGGSALNIVANTAIVQSQLFKNVFIPPCTEDSGLALGAAACAEWLKHGKMESHSPYLNNWGIENYKPEFSSATLQTIAKEIAGGKIIGVCNGFGETGPRALGNRSILTLADSKSLAQKLSIEKKGREWYRPLAPVALEKNTKYFTGEDTIHPLSKYMLLDFHVSTQKQKELEGAVHADGTARFQTLFKKEENPFLYELLQVLDEKYGIRALINTSFNSKGEPIVHTMEDALLSAKKMQLDGLVLNGKFQEL